MHSHSGQFCPGHAQDQLEEVIKHAISVGYKTIGLTEHMPRTDLEDLYPEEVTAPYVISSQLRESQTHLYHSLMNLRNHWLSLRPATRPTSRKPSACRPPTPRKFTS